MDPAVLVRGALAAIWETGKWPTFDRIVTVLDQVHRWEQDLEVSVSTVVSGAGLVGPGAPTMLTSMLERLMEAGEVSEQTAPELGWSVLVPSVELIDRWLPLDPHGRHVDQNLLPDVPVDHRSVSGWLGTAANRLYDETEWSIIQRPIDDAALLDAELRGRAEAWISAARGLRRRWEDGAIEGDRPPDDTVGRQLEQGADYLAQVGELDRARRVWRETAQTWLQVANRTGEQRPVVSALTNALLARDTPLLEAAVALVRGEHEWLFSDWEQARRDVLVGLLMRDDAQARSGAGRLDGFDQRKRKGGADVAIGRAATAILDEDLEGLADSWQRLLEQHVRYVKHGNRDAGAPNHTAMVLQELARRYGIKAPPHARAFDLTVRIRTIDRWHGRPVLRHQVQGPVRLLPPLS